MKNYLFLLLCMFNTVIYAQKLPNEVIKHDFATQDVNFKSEGINLEGTLFKPKNVHAAIVLVHGSGQEKRMLNMATFLAENGIAVFTYDKRGVGKSGGIYAGPEVGTNNIDPSNLKLLAADANGAAKVLSESLSDKHIPLGLMGFSQAGWVIPLAANKNRKINFMLLFSGPVVNTLEQLRFQFYTNGDSNFWDTHTEAEARTHINSDADRYQFIATDPQEALAKLSIPALWLFGGKDIQIPVNLSAEHLNALKAKGKPYEYRIFPTFGHNTSSLKLKEPLNFALEWIRNLSEEFNKKGHHPRKK